MMSLNMIPTTRKRNTTVMIKIKKVVNSRDERRKWDDIKQDWFVTDF